MNRQFAPSVAHGQIRSKASGGRVNGPLFAMFLMGYFGLSDRVHLSLATGGRGLLPLFPLALPLVVLAGGVMPGTGRDLRVLRARRFWLAGGLYALMATLLALAAVADPAYSFRSILSVIEAITIVSFVLMGSAVARGGPRVERQLTRTIAALVVVHALAAVLQFLQASGIHQDGLTEALAAWDQSTQLDYSESYVIVGRSVGLFVNPNTLGFWAVLGYWAALCLMKGYERRVIAGCSLIALVLSQSRGALAALLASLAAETIATLARNVAHGQIRSEKLRQVLMIGAVAALIGGTLWALEPGLPLQVPILSSMQERYRGGLSVIGAGVSADENLQARVAVWKDAVTFVQDRLFGTKGPPQVIFGASIDNEYVRALLQGGPLFLVLLIMTITSLLLSPSSGAWNRFVARAGLAVAIVAWTALPIGALPMGMVWLALGVALQLRRRGLSRSGLPSARDSSPSSASALGGS